MESLNLRIITPEGLAVAAECTSVTVPSACGELQILPGHSNYVGLVATGLLSYNNTDGTTHYGVVSDGSCEASLSGNCVLLVEQWRPFTESTSEAIREHFSVVANQLDDPNITPTERATLLGFQLAYKKLSEVNGIDL